MKKKDYYIVISNGENTESFIISTINNDFAWLWGQKEMEKNYKGYNIVSVKEMKENFEFKKLSITSNK